jgi:probable rRNA maturation factor
MRVSVIRDQCLSPRQRRVAAEARLGTLLRVCGERLDVPARAGLSVRLTGDAELRELNARFLGIDAATDVLAFPAGDRSRVGDVAISVERAIDQASDGVAEVRLLAVHGLLHCLGHDHALPDQAAAMTAVTRTLLPGADVPDLQTTVLAESQ